MATPEFVRYIGTGENGLKKGDVVKVLTERCIRYSLYVESPERKNYIGDNAKNPDKLRGKNFTYLLGSEYELIEEKKKMEITNKFKVGDIICGNSATRYSWTNTDMTRGEVIEICNNRLIKVKILEHKNSFLVGNIFTVESEYFDLATAPALYHITTDMKTFVEIEHDDNEAKSKCNVTVDKFNLHTGIDIAMDRLEEIENPKKSELPKYVRYIGEFNNNNLSGGLNKGDICKVLTKAVNCSYDKTLFVKCPQKTNYNNINALDKSALEGHNFTYLWPNHYEPVTIYD